MTPRDLVGLYLLAGLVCSVVVLRRGRATETRTRTSRLSRVASALETIPFWPLWAPVVLGSPPTDLARSRHHARTHAARASRALEEAAAAARATPLQDVFSQDVVARIAAAVTRLSQRLAELDALLAGETFDRNPPALEGAKASSRAAATARMHLEALDRLRRLRAADDQALEELADLLHALRTLLALSRYTTATTDDVTHVLGELFARMEGLDTATSELP